MKTFILLCLLLTGCASQKTLVNPNATTTQANNDTLACRYEAMKVEASTPNAIQGVLNGREAMRMCLQLRGYN